MNVATFSYKLGITFQLVLGRISKAFLLKTCTICKQQKNGSEAHTGGTDLAFSPAVRGYVQLRQVAHSGGSC